MVTCSYLILVIGLLLQFGAGETLEEGESPNSVEVGDHDSVSDDGKFIPRRPASYSGNHAKPHIVICTGRV